MSEFSVDASDTPKKATEEKALKVEVPVVVLPTKPVDYRWVMPQ
jgi:hypothetical protein